MAGLFQSFRSSSMPKRLLRYALSRLELLDSDALDMDNLDLALGRNTVFEFRDVGVQLDKLEKLLKLPKTFALQKAKVVLLRVTIPMDFYTSPISIEVDGVDVKLKVVVPDAKAKSSHPTTTTSDDDDTAAAAVPNTVDLAQSFLETQPTSERKKLEAALAAETQDLGASASMSDDSSEDEPVVGTGQPLSLPGFLAGFLQGIVDRMQIKIQGVAFQLDMDIPVDITASATEPVSFQIALEGIDIEGVTTKSEGSRASPVAAPKEGKRQISLDNVRAYLISEANVFSTLTRSSSMASPSAASSPVHTRNPPSRQATSLSLESLQEPAFEPSFAPSFAPSALPSHSGYLDRSQQSPRDSVHSQQMSTSQASSSNPSIQSLHASFLGRGADIRDSDQSNYPLADSEEALGIPYEFEDDGGLEDECPATPRASQSRDFDSPEDAIFHSPEDPALNSSSTLRRDLDDRLSLSQDFFDEQGLDSSLSSQHREGLEAFGIYGLQPPSEPEFDGRPEPEDVIEDLSQSHLYTHEEAESMYMSAFSKAGGQSSDDISELESSRHTLHPAEVEEHTLYPAEVDEHILPPADVVEHALSSGDVDEQILPTADVDEHPPSAADVDEHPSPAADADEHTLPPTDVDQHTHSPAGVDEHTPSPADVDEQTVPPVDVDRQATPPPMEETTDLMRTPQPIQGRFSPSAAPFSMPGGWDDDASQYSAETDRAASPATRTEKQHSPRRSISEPQPQVVPEPEAEFTAGPGIAQRKSSSPTVPQTPTKDEINSRDMEENSSHLEDTATPKGPTRVVKEILHLQSVSVYIPTTHPHIELEEDTSESVAELARAMSNSVYPQAPGAFSVHAPASGSVFEHRPHLQQTQSVDNVLEVDLSPVSIRFDASLAFVLAMIVGKLLDAVKSKHPVAKPHQGADAAQQQQEKAPEVRVTVQEVSVDFLNRLAGVTDTPRRHLDPSAFMFDHEVLLNATLRNLGVSVSPVKIPSAHAARGTAGEAQDAIQTRIDLETFRFGYSNGDIISFDKAAQMSTSVRDTFLSNGHDIAIKMAQAKDSVRTEIETLPLAVHVDLQRLDETFSWFGGLSSFLNMSASMTSSPSPTPKSPSKPAQRPKGVRFETPINPDDKSAVSENKINMRIGGSYIELVGRECSFVAESNAIKFINRERGAGVSCSRMRVSGPYLKNSMAKPAINTEIGGVRLEFVTTPNDSDLERLLGLITPSKAKFDHGSDEIMVDTLIRQRRKGSVLRVGVETLNVRVKNLAQLEVLPTLTEELAKLSTVAKYLPEDDRPGIMTLAKVQELGASVDLGGTFGQLSGELKELEAAHISIPSLVAVAVSGISVRRNKTEELISSSVLYPSAEIANRGPVIMARMIGDDIEPIVKLNLQDISIEYRVPTIMDILGLANDATPQDFEESLAASVASLGDQAHAALARQQPLSPTHAPTKQSKPLTLDVSFRDCLVGLNPLNQKSKMVLMFTDARLAVVLPKDEVTKVSLDVNKASILLTDDASQTASNYRPSSSTRRRASSSASPQAVSLSAQGFVDICYMSSAKVTVVVAPGIDGEKQVEVEVRDDLLVLETCADSTQTLISLANALSPPTPPSKENKYRTKVMPVQDLLASISAEAFGRPEGEYDFDQDFAGAQEMAKSQSEADFGMNNNFPIESQFYGDEAEGEELFDAMKLSATSQDTRMQDTQEGVLITGLDRSHSHFSEGSDDLAFKEDFFNESAPDEHGAKIWNSTRNSYDKAPPNLVKRSPLKVSVRDVHVIWNLFDGYDWTHTRDTISKAVQDVETKVYERQARLGGRQVFEEEIEDEETIGDFLFNSIYIGIPASRDPQELSRAINEGLADNATETESIATTAVTTSTNRTVRRGGYPKSRRLKLQRSKHHKITFELQGVNVDMVAFPPGTGETQSSVDIRVQNLDIFDHVPTSTWKKFVTYDRDQGEREMGTSMVHLELLTVKPLPELGASEIVLRATVLPLRLHVDQDALDFITRFFEFKDDSVPVHSSPSDVPFLQRAEVHDIPVKLDFKPKRVDYAGLRSGHTTEFMNFITLEESRMVLRHTIIYGVSGFDRLGKTLNDIWTPDVRNNQLPGVVAGLAPVRSLVNIGSGFKDLIEIPLKEYQKDGRIIRSISKGAAAFARTTGTELVKFGAKLAVGTQYALQGAEDMLTTGLKPDDGWDEDDPDAEDKKQISIYADHPTGVIQGIRGGYRSLARDVNMARDAIIAVPGEVMESQTATGAAKAVLRRAPTIIFRPAVGVSKAIGQTLMGATNSIDPHNQRRIDEKYKKH